VKYLVLLAAAVLTAACQSASPTPQIIYVTPAPTVRPTAVPTPVDPSAANWHAYRTQTSSWLGTLVADLTLVSDATTTLNYADIATSTATTEALIADEIAWLDAHPPSVCYAAVQTGFRGELQLFADSMHHLADGASTSNLALVTRAKSELDKGTAAVVATNALLDSVVC
jgi:hypothetical protein